ncbi:DUF2141 domain-containing protein [Robiginitalea aurantiaca]|uniref:DUF2141 domain-containing protein n=1 Tax=Robiginitalea aurantiaca TaxID=3056915 RepID=A0ABT7WAY0_9FLAO|nr:DUF2141 domain-containing protein [Robiginitalea aurantiaca]MDM9630078.1 DUF2141 domain-containing protein [Robiginitalea aurantiaca]
MRSQLFWAILSLPFFLSAQTATLEVRVHDVSSSDGDILVALYKEEKTFLKFEHVYRTEEAPALEGTTHLIIADLPYGDYALAIFHDENGNDELDTNFIGIPKEPLGFSNARLKTFGPPGFKECLVRFREDTLIEITLE